MVRCRLQPAPPVINAADARIHQSIVVNLRLIFRFTFATPVRLLAEHPGLVARSRTLSNATRSAIPRPLQPLVGHCAISLATMLSGKTAPSPDSGLSPFRYPMESLACHRRPK